jgi:hypothetical protein
MAIIECQKYVGSISGILECEGEPDNLAAIMAVSMTVIVGLIIWMSVRYWREFRHLKARLRQNENNPIDFGLAPPFSGPDHASSVHQFANRDYFQYLLTALQEGLHSEGYELTRDARCRILLTTEIFNRLASNVFMAREHYMAPLQSEDLLKEKVEECSTNGYSARWLQLLIDGSAAQGWYVTRSVSEDVETVSNDLHSWASVAYPLKQVVITVSGGKNVLTRDMVRCLSEAASVVQDNPFPFTAEGIAHSGMSDIDDLQYALLCRSCVNSPGFFPDDAGTKIPEHLLKGGCAPRPSPHRKLTVFVQGTRNTPLQVLAYFATEAGKRFAAGECSGARYDDDSGYAFTLQAAVSQTDLDLQLSGMSCTPTVVHSPNVAAANTP